MEAADKYAWQEKCLEAWGSNHYRGIVQAVTGSGKTMLALKAMEKLERDLGRRIRVKIVVPTKSLMLQWERALKQEKLETEFHGAIDRCFAEIGCHGGTRKDSPNRKYMVYVINSARYQLARCILEELKSGERVLLIADECHHYASGENRKIFDFIPFLSKYPDQYFAMGLSATLQAAEGGSLLEEGLGKRIYNYSFGQALRYGTVCDFIIFQIAVSFLPDELAEYENISEEIRSVGMQLYIKYPFLKEPGTPFFAVIQSLAEGGEGMLANLAKTYLMLSYQRKRMICMAGNRILCVCQLVEQLGGREQCFIFGESIEQADALYHTLCQKYRGKVGRYHSQMGKQANYNILERFRNGELRILIACRSLDEGIDIPNAAIGIILSGTSMERQRMQRLGRILRCSKDKTYAKLYYLFVKESREEKAYFPLQGENFRTEDLEYDAHAGKFVHAAYEQKMSRILDRWTAEGMEEAFRKEAEYCLRQGMLHTDWLLEEQQIKNKLAEAKTERERNYWLCMLAMRENR